MIAYEKEGVRWLEFELLQEFSNLCHAVFMKGDSHFSLSNTPDARGNLQKAMELLNLDSLAFAHQMHGNEVYLVREITGEEPRCDALITNRPGIGLKIKHADCQAAILYDPTHHALANVHCGWRGSVKNIYANTIDRMKEVFFTDPADLIVCIGPSLGPKSAEFVNYRKELPEPFWQFRSGPLHFDFWEITRRQLLEKGVRDKQIEIASIDTYRHDDCFSYRKKQNGRHGTIACLL